MSTKSFLLNLFLSLGLFCASFYLAWQISAATNFFYSFWYEVIEIDQTIKSYGPKNKHRQNFEITDKQQQVELFSGIVASIQNNGIGFDKLKYKNSDGEVIDSLLTKAEVVHLQDVANLVNRFKYLAIVGGVIALITFLLIRKINIKLAPIKYQSLGGLGVIIALLVVILLAGPTKVFYAGHELIFPDNHQWFFYYEDSLMSTMMKAPVLFGPIACELLALTILFWLMSLLALQKLKL